MAHNNSDEGVLAVVVVASTTLADVGHFLPEIAGPAFRCVSWSKHRDYTGIPGAIAAPHSPAEDPPAPLLLLSCSRRVYGRRTWR
jgi:hypothetical protein